MNININYNIIKFIIFIVFFYLIMINIFDYNISEGFNGFNWKHLINNNVNNIDNNNDNNNIPKPIDHSLHHACTFPHCPTFDGVENTWNENNRNNRNNRNKDNYDSYNKKNNYRVSVPSSQFLSFNIFSPRCCEYTQQYTNGTGCACLTPQQLQLLDFRYGNRA